MSDVIFLKNFSPAAVAVEDDGYDFFGTAICRLSKYGPKQVTLYGSARSLIARLHDRHGVYLHGATIRTVWSDIILFFPRSNNIPLYWKVTRGDFRHDTCLIEFVPENDFDKIPPFFAYWAGHLYELWPIPDLHLFRATECMIKRR